jgi:hypothetical protein
MLLAHKNSVFVTIFAKYWHCLCIQNLQQNRDPDMQSFNLYIFFDLLAKPAVVTAFILFKFEFGNIYSRRHPKQLVIR